jgi:hypothetical protein
MQIACSLELSAAYFQSASSNFFLTTNQPTIFSAAYFQLKQTGKPPSTYESTK